MLFNSRLHPKRQLLLKFSFFLCCLIITVVLLAVAYIEICHGILISINKNAESTDILEEFIKLH